MSESMNLSNESNNNQIRKYIQGLRMEIQKEQLLRKEDQEKWYNESQMRKISDQRLTEKEILLQRKNERIEYLEHTSHALQKKLDDLEHSIKDKGSSKFGLFKLFNGKENEQIKLQLKEYEEELEIKTEEIERLHVQIFELKRDAERREELFERRFQDAKQENDIMRIQYQQLNTQCSNLQTQLKEQETQCQERQAKIDEYLLMLQVPNHLIQENKEEQFLQTRESSAKQQMTIAEMHQSLQKSQAEIIQSNKEIKLLTDITQFVREYIKNLITMLENHEAGQIEVQEVLKNVKNFYQNKFTADIDREKRKLLLKTEKSITNEILQGQLKTSMRLEKQNGKLVQVNTILDEMMGLHPSAFEVFERAKDRILKMGKVNEALEKKNKALNDKLTLQQETKKIYQQ